jgi:hypothetical protein
MPSIIKQKDGTIVVYLKKDFTPVEKAQAEMVKIIKPNGDVTFGVPVKK